MRKLRLPGLLGVCASILAAAPCVPGSLQDYIDLGSAGCTIGPSLFSSFEALPLLPGAAAIAPFAIMVAPEDVPLRPTLRLDLTRSAGPAEILQTFFQFNVSDGALIGKQLSMSGSGASGDGVVTVVEELCMGGPFPASVFAGCAQAPETLVLFQIEGDSVTAVRAPLATADFLGVRMDITIDGGPAGTATLAGVTNRFESIPEPSGALVMLSGLATLWVARRRAVNALSGAGD
jgi:hypothetical protein